MTGPISRHPLGLAVAICWTLLALAVEAYAAWRVGPQHLLWCSHLGVSLSALAMWWPHRLLVSSVAVAIFLPECVWTLDVGLGLLLGGSPTGATAYMFGEWWPLDMQLLSLFHLGLPPVLWWQLTRVGYDRRALWVAPLALWPILIVSRLVGPGDNVNWVFDFGGVGLGLPGLWQTLAVAIGLPLAVYLPSHLLFRWCFALREPAPPPPVET